MNRQGTLRPRPRRTLRRLRLRAWHAARHHYMFGFTAVLLLLAGGASLGAFDRTEPELQLGRRVVAIAPPQPVTRVDAPQPPKLVMTYYVVGTQEMVDSFNMAKTELRHREWLEKSAFEVLLVRTPEEQAAAFRAIEDARERCVCLEFRVEDLRQ